MGATISDQRRDELLGRAPTAVEGSSRMPVSQRLPACDLRNRVAMKYGAKVIRPRHSGEQGNSSATPKDTVTAPSRDSQHPRAPGLCELEHSAHRGKSKRSRRAKRGSHRLSRMRYRYAGAWARWLRYTIWWAFTQRCPVLHAERHPTPAARSRRVRVERNAEAASDQLGRIVDCCAREKRERGGVDDDEGLRGVGCRKG